MMDGVPYSSGAKVERAKVSIGVMTAATVGEELEDEDDATDLGSLPLGAFQVFGPFPSLPPPAAKQFASV